ncbi:MAG: hypothetical protein HRT37_01970 [Alteromonadaceae bacterium]|nr:hypothetical protein [Alteromonadaceae bacterium]
MKSQVTKHIILLSACALAVNVALAQEHPSLPANAEDKKQAPWRLLK